MSFRPLNVLYLSSFGSLERGGQNSLLELVSRLDRGSFEPVVVVPDKGDLAKRLAEQQIEVIVYPLPPIMKSSPLIVLRTVAELARVLRRYKISLIHSDNVRNTFYLAIARSMRRIPLVWHVRVNEGNVLIDCLMSLMVDLIIAVSYEAKRRFPIRRERKFRVIHNAVDLDKFHPGIKPERIMCSGKPIPSGTLIGEIGAISREKAQEDLVRAFGAIQAKHKTAQLLFVGKMDKTYCQYLDGLIQQLDVSDRVHFLGYRKDIAQIISALDIVVLPSLSEGLPRIILEAMACGKPVIASDVGGNRELVVDGETGYLFPVRDWRILSEKLSDLLNDSQRRKHLGARGLQRASVCFDIKRQVLEIQKAYEQMTR